MSKKDQSITELLVYDRLFLLLVLVHHTLSLVKMGNLNSKEQSRE